VNILGADQFLVVRVSDADVQNVKKAFNTLWNSPRADVIREAGWTLWRLCIDHEIQLPNHSLVYRTAQFVIWLYREFGSEESIQAFLQTRESEQVGECLPTYMRDLMLTLSAAACLKPREGADTKKIVGDYLAKTPTAKSLRAKSTASVMETVEHDEGSLGIQQEVLLQQGLGEQSTVFGVDGDESRDIEEPKSCDSRETELSLLATPRQLIEDVATDGLADGDICVIEAVPCPLRVPTKGDSRRYIETMTVSESKATGQTSHIDSLVRDVEYEAGSSRPSGENTKSIDRASWFWFRLAAVLVFLQMPFEILFQLPTDVLYQLFAGWGDFPKEDIDVSAKSKEFEELEYE